MMALLRLRYGADEVEADFILEVRHFAELLDWPNARKCCEAHLESLLQQSKDVDGASLLAVVSHAEESSLMPPHLKAAALAAAVRQWSRVAEAAEAIPSESSTLMSQTETRYQWRSEMDTSLRRLMLNVDLDGDHRLRDPSSFGLTISLNKQFFFVLSLSSLLSMVF
eukprot:g25415.t1